MTTRRLSARPSSPTAPSGVVWGAAGAVSPWPTPDGARGQPRALATAGPGPSAIPTTARSGTPRGRTTG